MLSTFPAVVFGQWEKDKMLSIFPALVSMGMCRHGIAVAPDRQPGMAMLLQSLNLFSTPAMVAQASQAQDRASRVRTAKLALRSSTPSVASASA